MERRHKGILQVFLRVFNEKLGYSGNAPHIADMERHLVAKGAYETFKAAFAASKGRTWEQERDAVDFLRDDVVAALAQALKMTPESAGRWFNSARDDYRINIEGFAKVVNDYLATCCPANHKVIFLVDEVGQFIGANSQLMLSLQTITGELGTQCKGRAWVIVTSQEDIDAAIGEANKSKSQDFSKIQGRFHTRLSLASSNTDEVIGERLLAKTEAAHVTLRDAFAGKSDVINNQLGFVGNSVSLRGYKDTAEFVACYPFAPYQFTLLQKIFESIRKVGATGMHLSRGERSLLDAFQSATVSNADRSTDVLIPLYDFYPSIESFIDGMAKKSIDEAPLNPALQPYDSLLLKAMFLIRWRQASHALNREALNKVPQAATALAELIQIRDNPKPYGQVNRIEPLVATVTAVNEQIAQARREKALLSIDSKITEVRAKLDAMGAAPDLCNKTLRPLQELKTRIASQTSIAQILYLQGQGGDAMDDAIALIEAAEAKLPHHVATPGDTTKPVQTGQPNVPTVVKTTRVIWAADLCSKTYLETEADVDAFVSKLRTELMAAIHAGQMARVQ